MLHPNSLPMYAHHAPPPTIAKMDAPLRIVGYNDMAEMLTEAVRVLRTRHPELRVVLDLKSTRSAPPALIDRSADLAPMGAALSRSEYAAYRERWGCDPIGIRIAHDSLTDAALSSPTGILVATDNPLQVISLAQLHMLFSGHSDREPRWADLGVAGPWGAHPISLRGLAPDTALGQNFLHTLGTQKFADGGFGYRQSREVAAAISGDPYSIGFANLNHAGHGTRAVDIIDANGKRRRPNYNGIQSGRYPLDRHLMIYAHPGSDRAASKAARLLLTFLLSRQGQWIIARGRLGYIPLNPTELSEERRKLASFTTRHEC